MGSNDKAPEYPTTTTSSGGLYGTSTTNSSGSTWTPTNFQKQLVGISENNAANYLNEYLNPDYDSEAYHQSDDYYKNKMYNTLQNDYLNSALSNGLLRGSTAADTYRGFATDLANTEYERQQDYKNQQLQNYQAAMLPYTTVYDMYTGDTNLSSSLANNIANYNMEGYKQESANKNAQLSSLSSALNTGLSNMGKIASAFASDIRLKENLEKLDTVDGINIYKFDYIDGAKNQVGVIAQEMLDKCPECVLKGDDGYYRVDYAKLPDTVQARIEELK